MYAKGARRPSNATGRKSSITTQSTKGSTQQAPPTVAGAQSSSSTSQGSSSSATPSSMYPEPIPYHAPLVMTPVSQINAGNRRMSRVPSRPEDNMAYDPMSHNPDGSLKTMYTIPNFSKSYAQAMNARYVRHNVQPSRDQELSIQEIFDKK